MFDIDANVTATLSGLTITGGSTQANGGGLYNAGTLTLLDCTISGNSAFAGGGFTTPARPRSRTALSAGIRRRLGRRAFQPGDAILTAARIDRELNVRCTGGTGGV